MNKNKLKARIDRLRAEIEHHNRLYYTLAKPEISDYEYDMLVKELQELEAQYAEGAVEESPTQKVGSDLTPGAKTIPHKVRMASLENAYSLEEVLAFINRTNNDLGYASEYCAELKIDGFSINLYYENGNFIYATTRGDGLEGEDVTENFRLLPDVPFTIDYKGAIEIRGEIYIPVQDFLALNEFRRENELKTFANPRNAAAGSIKLKNREEVKSRHLKALFYALGYYETPLQYKNEIIDKQTRLLDFLDELGFPTSKRTLCKNYQEVEKFCLQMEQERYTIPYDIDGIVIKVNSLEDQKKLGWTAKSPKWAIAYKFKPEEKETILESVSFQVGRTGAVTPVANLKPIFISGSTVSHATLHNADEIKRLDLHYGDTVLVVKSGEIIPKILSVNVSKRPVNAKPVIFPATCPVCNAPLQRDEDGSINYCPNANCPAQIQRKLEHFASREAMDIYGLGSSLIARLIETGQIKWIPDIYHLDYNKIAEMERMGKKSANNLQKAIEASKTKNFDRVLFALGIRHIGSITARTLAQHFKNIDALIMAREEELLSVPDIGSIIARSIIGFFSQKSNRELIDSLRKVGLQFTYISPQSSAILAGKTFLITGTLPNYSRKDMETLITEHGGKILSGVSKQLNYLIVGENPGSKLDKARQLGTVKIISEAELLDMLQ